MLTFIHTNQTGTEANIHKDYKCIKANLLSLELLSRIRVTDKGELIESLLTGTLGILEHFVGADRSHDIQ